MKVIGKYLFHLVDYFDQYFSHLDDSIRSILDQGSQRSFVRELKYLVINKHLCSVHLPRQFFKWDSWCCLTSAIRFSLNSALVNWFLKSLQFAALDFLKTQLSSHFLCDHLGFPRRVLLKWYLSFWQESLSCSRYDLGHSNQTIQYTLCHSCQSQDFDYC